MTTIEGRDDEAEYRATVAAMKTLGFSDEDVHDAVLLCV